MKESLNLNSDLRERILRINEMDMRLNRISAWLTHFNTDENLIREDVRILDEYYRSPLWRSDFEADEAGKLPKELSRGVLSEDGVFNVLEAYQETGEGRIIRLGNQDAATVLIQMVDDHGLEGIGYELVNYLINNTQSEKIMLEVRESNTNAITLYIKCGFKEIHRRKNYYGNEDAIIMERSI